MMFNGSIVALITPMHENGDIDYNALEKLIDWHIQSGTQGLVVAGTTGESATLRKQEKLALIRQTVNWVASRIPVIAGTAMQSTADTLELTGLAMEAGADAALIMTPAYIKPTQAGLIQHYQTIAEAMPLPIILYNVPSRTACDLLTETVATLAEIETIVAIKEATASIDRLLTLKNLCADKIQYLSGDDLTAASFILNGGHGTISVTANIAPKEMAELCQYSLKKEYESAKSLDQRLSSLHRLLFVESNPIPVKYLLSQMGFIENHLRLPLTPLSKSFTDKLYKAYQVAELHQ